MFTVTATLDKDAVPYGDSVQLNYHSRMARHAFTGPPKEKCPPIDKLKAGTRVVITYEGKPHAMGARTMGLKILKVELA